MKRFWVALVAAASGVLVALAAAGVSSGQIPGLPPIPTFPSISVPVPNPPPPPPTPAPPANPQPTPTTITQPPPATTGGQVCAAARPTADVASPSVSTLQGPTENFTVAFSGTNSARFKVEFRELSRRARASAAASSWKLIPRSRYASSNSVTFHGTRGRTYEFRVRGLNSCGTHSQPAFSTTVVPFDERSEMVTLHGGWGSVRQGRAFRRHFAVADDKRATMTASVYGGSIKLIAPTGPAGGKAVVKVGQKTKVVSFYSPTGHDRQVVFSTTLGVGRHTISMHPIHRKSNASRGYKVAVDAIAVANARR